jgi:hypothetical protein
MSIGDSNAGMGFDHPVTSKVLLGPNSVVDRRFLPPDCTSWVPGACACIHRQNQRSTKVYTQISGAICIVGMLVCACERQFSTRANT